MKHLIHWAWRLNQTANWLTLYTGRIAGTLTRWAIRKDGEAR